MSLSACTASAQENMTQQENMTGEFDLVVPEGFEIQQYKTGLAGPIGLAWDDQGRLIVAEAGADGIGTPAVTRFEQNGSKTVLASGSDFGNQTPVTAVNYINGTIYVVHAGTVSKIDEAGNLIPVVTGLPGIGDHQADQLVFKDGWIYLSMGTVTNSGVVGPDNMPWLANYSDLHDVPCQDIRLSENNVFTSPNPLTPENDTINTSPYHPFGEVAPPNSTVEGNVKCNGAVLKFRPDGTNLSAVAWGMRNPFGLEEGPNGSLYFTMHGSDIRGSRPIANASDFFYMLEEGAWYGWPDFIGGEPVTLPKFDPDPETPGPFFILAEHPSTPPVPIAEYPPHSGATGFDFAPEGWGEPADAYIALQGDMAPETGDIPAPRGFKIVKTNAETGETEDFIYNVNDLGPAWAFNITGFNRPVEVDFYNGEMYIADFGEYGVGIEPGFHVELNSGVIWKVTMTNMTSQEN